MGNVRWALSALVAVLSFAAVPGAALGVGDQGVRQGKGDLDTRVGSIVPTAAQRAEVSALGARASWNRFGTPASLIRYDGYLAQGLAGDAATVARTFVTLHAGLFKLTDTSPAALELVSDTKLTGSNAHAVLFRQRFGSLASTQDGMIAVGVVAGKVAYVSSSAAGTRPAPGAATLTPAAAWLRAAADAGLTAAAGDVTVAGTRGDWTLLTVTGLPQQQRAKLAAFLTTTGVRPAFQPLVLKDSGATSLAYISYVDAQTGDVLFRQNAVYNVATPTTTPFQGEYTATGCGPYHDFTVTPGSSSLDVAATAAVPSNDIVLTLEFPRGNVIGSSDTATSPEAVHYSPAGGVLPGVYSVRVCPFSDPTVPATAPFTYAGAFTTNPVGTPAVPALPTPPLVPSPFVPRWQYFPANPRLDYSGADSRIVGCWTTAAGCSLTVANAASRQPWDVDPNTGAPSNTTRGNNANSAEAWGSPLTPGEHYQPAALDRSYTFAWTNQWLASRCSPTAFASPRRNDVDAAAVNLFAMHNRMHDFSYRLGFTEKTWNLQQSNWGETDGNGERDPELGDVQAGGVTGGAPSYLGRDNANQIALPDGVPGITNMYLWQPIAGGFYPPCVDGDYDLSVIGHEYTHAISNRMVGGPDANLTGLQAGAMGESWSDLDAEEFLHESGLVPTDDESAWAIGPYVTGNKAKGIRDYALDANPLDFSDVGFDITGPEVHADGEIWNAVNYELRQALVAKYDGAFPSSSRALQLDCANGVTPVEQCPGNRRWAQIMFDAFLLMQPGVSMVDARDAYLAADRLRFGGANQAELWHAFALRGLGEGASSAGADDDQPTPSYASPLEADANVRLAASDEAGNAIPATLYVGVYEARVTPVGDTVSLVPGTYSFVARAAGTASCGSRAPSPRPTRRSP